MMEPTLASLAAYFAALELPIKKVLVDGPAVRALAARKEAGDARQITTAAIVGSYSSIKPALLAALTAPWLKEVR